MPTHGHGHGYSDLNFLIPELVSGVQFSKGPYFAEQGDFTTAGVGQHQLRQLRSSGRWCRLGGGGQGFGRVLAAASPTRRRRATARRDRTAAQRRAVGHGPTTSRRSTASCATAGAMASTGSRSRPWDTAARWNATDQIPRARRRRAALIGRFGDSTRPTAASRRATAPRSNGSARAARRRPRSRPIGIAYDLDLFSNFTYFLDDPVNGDQFQQADRRVVSGAKSHAPAHRVRGQARPCRTRSACRCATTTSAVSASTTPRRVGDWRPSARTRVADQPRRVRAERDRVDAVAADLAGVRVDGYRFDVEAGEAANSGTERRLARQPEGRRRAGPVEGDRGLRERRRAAFTATTRAARRSRSIR